MKRYGRSDNAAGFRRYKQGSRCLSGVLDKRRLSGPFVCTLTTLAVTLTATLVFAKNDAGSDARLPSDAAVYASSTDNLPDYPEKSSPTSSAALGSDSAEEPSPISASGSETMTEIPGAMRTTATTTAGSAAAPAGDAAGLQNGAADYDDGIIRYQHAKSPEINGPPIGSLQDFMSEGDISSPLGIEVREDKRRLKSGGEAQGLLIIEVFAGSPAARAGLHAYHRAMRDALETAAVAGAMFFPPAVLLVPVFDQVHLGESYDLIIGVDGSRVANFLDFEERVRDVQAGEIVYFSIVRNGERMQIPVPVPDNLAGPIF